MTEATGDSKFKIQQIWRERFIPLVHNVNILNLHFWFDYRFLKCQMFEALKRSGVNFAVLQFNQAFNKLYFLILNNSQKDSQ